MQTLDFRKWNTITGWIVFLIAFTTYSLTVEPTVSFWDCGEYISTSAKLEVGHPPGAPFFQMLGAFFAMFALEKTQIAKMVNYTSVVSSAFTILFLFWTITNLAQKLLQSQKRQDQIIALGSGAVGALAFTFSDSFWFNAVETEVYAMATLVMALLIWLGLKWTDNLETPRGNKWLILISLITGLTFGIQFLGFLAIPSVGLLYYFKKYKTTTVKNFLIANIAVIAVLMLIYKFSLTYVLKIFGWAEIFFVNTIGLPFNSGTIIMGLVFIIGFYSALQYTKNKALVTLNTLVLCVLFMFIGFSSWLMLPIRANSNVVINENNPANARDLLAYYNREQYPSIDSPFYGEHYTSMFSGMDSENPYRDGKPKYEQDKKTGKYVIINTWKNSEISPNQKHVGLLPRMWSPDHAENYMKIAGPVDFKLISSNTFLSDLEELKEEPLTNEEKRYYLDSYNQIKERAAQTRYAMQNGEISEQQYMDFLKKFSDYITVEKPSISQSIHFLLEYQLGYMYWRYFLWNFSGRQDDIQGKYDNHGNWISGIPLIDNLHLGSQTNLPTDIVNNKARNTYFLLPLLLGIFGVVYQIKRKPKQFWPLFVFFILTGIAVQLYTNIRPFEPRERDYSLVGSFYGFSIWIGIGTLAVYQEVLKYLKKPIVAPLTILACISSVPVVMAYQNWDDHDRSNRYTARAMAKSYLDSVQKDADAMIFTIGDNDTFTLWYMQQIENYRTDVRTINTQLLATDWYIDQMKQKAHKSSAIPSQLTHEQYKWGTRDVIYYQPIKGISENRWDIKDFMSWIASDNPKTKVTLNSGIKAPFYPTNKIRVAVNKQNVLQSGLVKAKDSSAIVDYIDIDLPKSAMTKNNLMMLDILANNHWKRPIYFSGGSFSDSEYIWMKEYLQLDGLVYKLVPIKTPIDPENPYDMGRIDSDLMYNIVMQWDWGNSGDLNMHHDTETRRNSFNYRGNLARLCESLLAEKQLEKAKKISDLVLEKMPVAVFNDPQTLSMYDPYIDTYYKVDEKQKARTLFKQVSKRYKEALSYYSALSLDQQYEKAGKIIRNIEYYRNIIDIVVEHRDEVFLKEVFGTFQRYIERFRHFYEDEPSTDTKTEATSNTKDTIE